MLSIVKGINKLKKKKIYIYISKENDNEGPIMFWSPVFYFVMHTL